jgi:hypothetical protein
MLAGAMPGGAATVAGAAPVLAPVLGLAAAKGGGRTAESGAGCGAGVAAAAGSLGFLISSEGARASVAVVMLTVWTATCTFCDWTFCGAGGAVAAAIGRKVGVCGGAI